MERTQALLKKLADLNNQQPKTKIDIDLMLDHTRELYSLLLEQREIPSINPELPKTEVIAASSPIELSVPEPEPPAPLKEIQPLIEEPSLQATAVVEAQTTAEPAFLNGVQQPKRDIRKSIGINDKYQIMSELFSNDKEAYDTILGELNSFNNYPEAHTWLRAHLSESPTWDEESYTVQLLYGLMQRFFAENKQY